MRCWRLHLLRLHATIGTNNWNKKWGQVRISCVVSERQAGAGDAVATAHLSFIRQISGLTSHNPS